MSILPSHSKNGYVIALTNQKVGVGKTTTAVNLGVGLAMQGKKVLLVDADAQANLTMALCFSLYKEHRFGTLKGSKFIQFAFNVLRMKVE